jgi:arginase
VAARIVRQVDKIVLLGAPTSAAALSAGHEAAPQALRTAGLPDQLRSIGYTVVDLGDDLTQIFKPDEESPRARNLRGVLKSIESLKPRVEEAVKSGGLPVILGGDCSIVLAIVAGARRYFRRVGLVYMDRDADLQSPATTRSGCVDGMVVSHLTGRGAAELVRFWGEPPLVREPDLALFGFERIEPAEEEVLRGSTVRSYPASDVKRKGAATAAESAIGSIHGDSHEFVLQLDVDVIENFPATNYPGAGGLTLEDVRDALRLIFKRKNLIAVSVTAYNPAKDPDGSQAKVIVDLVAEALAERLKALQSTAVESSAPAQSAEKTETPAPVSSERGSVESAPAVAGQAWSSDSLDSDSEATESAPQTESSDV